ncbi:hypothetical protein [Pantoea sp. SORGH_AS_0659]|uniref:hypothetical protein n=1 Tax=Pantoea sp. SORGH_AS_0659 TaxID=3062597 RepID=UPI002855C95A|nr:hypothetical protein [Pantoea sp. SORGH_AS_0659]MDR6350866.1 hypothetical protein [Pantoea sp. SORGH_AS_0659]
MGYWKFIKPEQLAAWDKLRSDEQLMRAEGFALAEKFQAKPVFTNDVGRSTFYGVKFDKGFYVAKDLWTKPTSNTGFASWPKARAPKGLSEEHKSLLVIWKENYPKTKVENDQFYTSIGLDWGMLFLTGITYFRFGDAIYVKTGAKPNEDAQAVEILGSEFDSAKREYVDAASA